VLQVEIQDVQPFPERPWGFTAVLDKSNGGGFLDEEFPQAAKGQLSSLPSPLSS
jgi:formamidase